jgi:hypothetical protein
MLTRSHTGLLAMPAFLIIVLLGALLAQSTAAALVVWRIRDVPSELRPVISRADVIVATMQDALLRELNSGLERGGPARAIKSCHIDAARIADRLGRQAGVSAGRTADRLRNPVNAPKPWATGIVAANAGRRAEDVDGFAVDLGDKIGVLRPIAHRTMCASCHGRDDELDGAVLAELKQRYPSDRATGFREGEIRGWYWVELPKQP